jgi:predicted flap endonuclease-1-like 5' DNA nuclease
MIEYLPITISAIIIFTALMWWLLALGRVKKDATRPSGEISPKGISAPPVATTPPPAAPRVAEPAQLMETAKAAPKPKAKAPAKAKAEKAVAAPAPMPKPKTAAPKAKPAATTKAAPAPEKAATAAPKKAAAAAVKAAPAPKPKVAPAAKPKAAPAAKKAAPVPAPAAKPKAVAKAKAAPKAKSVPAKPSIPDDLALLKGVGPKLVAQLKTLGVTSFEQVANWSASDIAEIDSKLGVFAGRITRDNWVDQAKLLVAGDVAGFEKKYGALGSEIAKG